MDCREVRKAYLGRAGFIRAGSEDKVELPGKFSRLFGQGDVLAIETPGGGAWGGRWLGATSLWFALFYGRLGCVRW